MLIQTIQMISASPLLFAALASAATVAPSPKRGLVYTPNKAWPQDDTVWVQAGSDLTWYYNYMPFPSPVYANSLPQSLFEFVPMFWGAPTDPDNTTFLESVKSLVESGTNISHVLGFNEPDGPNYTGGSDVSPAIAANAWVKNMIPLQEMGIRVGLPACTSAPSGLPWIRSFLEECSKLISTGGQKKNCTFDFVPLHYYGKFEGLASHIGEYAATFPNKSLWITEYNLPHSSLQATQEFFNMSAEYFDRLDYIERYSFFGACRSKVCNIGPNGAMLSNDGRLTDIGSLYLGFPPTGVLPTGLAAIAGTPSFWVLSTAVVGAAVVALSGVF